ncbi:acyltransferase [Paramicrobacterium chengjingii]|uniref:acyltransferase n=1 Tax=Paramicrobacterium chengjingii TaxID=2769067 RepID=UPI00141E6A89|nr:acyltransferase [Microbacterium chengjingii]
MISRFEHSPWSFWAEGSTDEHDAQRAYQATLKREHPSWRIGDDCVISELASVHPAQFSLGDRSYIAASAYVTDRIVIGSDCSVNPFCVVRGDVSMGDAVRIGAHTSILGFNHSMEPGTEVFRQPLVTSGISIGDDVWIGSHVVILDGVTVGSHAVIGAGAVVTKNVASGAVVVGNPARFVRWRVPPTSASEADSPLGDEAAAFAERARSQVHDVLDRSWDAGRQLYTDRPGIAVSVRAQCDAIELSMLLTGAPPPNVTASGQREMLRGWQDPQTGLVASIDGHGRQSTSALFENGDVAYHIECVGYALDLLGSAFPHSLRVVTEGSAEELARRLNNLPWARNAWGAGHVVDAIGTAVHWSRRRGDVVPDGFLETLFGWLTTHSDARTGMWGDPTPDDGLLQPVNGFYRASRGTFAQFGVPIQHPDAVVDTVLRHAHESRFFSPAAQNACNVLDVAHPLWLTRATGYRSEEVRELATRLLRDALARWTDGSGIGFRASPGSVNGQPDANPGLQGTEMWLSTIWYLADLIDVSPALGYRPRGIHRPEPGAHF